MADNEIRYVAVGMTDVGQVREHNEDNFLAVDLAADKRGTSGEALSGQVRQRGLSLVVADGMGGAAAGEVASQLAVDTLNGEFKNADLGGTVRSEPDVISLLETAINKANELIFRQAAENKDQQGMGTTLTASVILGDSLYLSQVGDSRGYLLRKGKLVQMTRDQSLIGQLIEEGTLTEEQAEKIGGKNIILQALGVEESLKIDSKRYDILRGDTLMLCSDGLTGMATDAVIEQILNEKTDLKTAAKALIDAANAGGGKDNITVIVARFEGEGLREPLTALTDADKAGGSFKAPPPPKSKAGRNAFLATAGLLVVLALFLFWPKPKKLVVGVTFATGTSANPTVTVKASAEGGKPGFVERKEPVKDGRASFELDEGFLYEATAAADGYSPQTVTVDTSVPHTEIAKNIELFLVPATSLDLVGPTYRGKARTDVKVELKPENPKTGPTTETSPKAEGEVEYPGGFPAGAWTAGVTRAGFAGGVVTFTAGSGKAEKVDLPALDDLEQFGSLTVTEVKENAEVSVFDGEERLLGPVTVPATRSVTFDRVRATTVLVKVTGPSLQVPDQKRTIPVGGGETISLGAVTARVVFIGPRDSLVRMQAEGGRPKIIPLLADGPAAPQNVPPGSYTITISLPNGETRDVQRTLEPGELFEADIEKLK